MRTYAIHLICALAFSLSATAAWGQTARDTTVQPHIRALYEAYVGRPLTATEWGNVLMIEEAQDIQYTEAGLAELDRITKILHDEIGKPSALHQRHRIVTEIVFKRWAMNSNPEQFLLNLDPVAVLDAQTRRLMTLADVRALIGIHQFAATGADPRTIALPSPETAVKLSAVLRASIMKGGGLPSLHCEAAAFWAGLTQNWGQLGEAERTAARNYAKHSLATGAGVVPTMPDELYMKLSGWSQTELDERKRALRSGQIAATALGWHIMFDTQNLMHQSYMVNLSFQNLMTTLSSPNP